MPRKIPDETRELMGELYDGGLSVREISRRTGTAYSTTYGYTRVRQRVNPETGQPFKSLSELQDYQVRQRVNPETGQPFKSLTELRDYRARQRVNPETGQLFKSLTELRDYRARQRVNPETEQLFRSLSELQDYQVRQRQQQPVNHRLGVLIKQRLPELGKNQKWLAQQLGITKGTVSRYLSGKTTPRRSLQEELFKTLELPYETLDDTGLN